VTALANVQANSNDGGLAVAVRREGILARLRSVGSVTVGDLASAFETSDATIRRDLGVLEDDGLLRRIHGGAVSVITRAYEPTFSEKSRQFIEEKRRIATVAAEMVHPGDTLILSPGTTTAEIGRCLHGHRNLTLITPAVNIAADMAANPNIEVIVTGGRLRGNTYALVGALAEKSLQGLRVDKLFLGGNGLTAAHGLTTPDLEMAMLDRALARAARQVIVVVDHSKIGQVALCQTVPLDQIHTLITDAGVPPADRESLARAGLQVIVA
jgi:DeoR/GlpR family transcriptional regulator of sugar metabolism